MPQLLLIDANSPPTAEQLPLEEFSRSKGERICEGIVEGASLLELVEISAEEPEPWLPSIRRIYYWLRRYPEFKADYDEALAIRADILAMSVVDIAYNHKMTFDDRKMAIAALQWTSSKLNPKLWGEKKTIDANINTRIQTISHIDVGHLSLEEIRIIEQALAGAPAQTTQKRAAGLGGGLSSATMGDVTDIELMPVPTR